ncbi:NAD(P)-binding domain-containing protein [Parenemella sanctibonifatiensis]|uniref:Pyridine nucleotide-disulfide oxidoreductase n=1 Tax=Parenemella sanctibonifatiensis TaxID=2016505 RepID=A0A255EAR9_9ACTN|nr:NAD(P)-binding domain-containing protein [Parenemella sanctibonifatiensis]OYN88658.1 pyridine nucleotide-disulfide oxidoreductase [Parenemella sanctibonifatiensis]
MTERDRVKVVVIGAGQAGLSAAYFLGARGLAPGVDFVVLDANDGPGGAWRHRWDSLTFGVAHGIHNLPGYPLDRPDSREPAREIVKRYYGAYEEHFGLPVVRPAPVASVVETDPGFEIVTRDGRRWRSDAVINATGTWDRPFWPTVAGQRSFAGRQLHTRDYVAAEEFTGQRVLVVGGGTSAAQFLLQLADAGVTTVWSTRRPPDWTAQRFDQEWGIDVERRVQAYTTQGLPTRSVVANTGLPLTDQYIASIRSGVLVSRGPLVRLTETGAVLAVSGPGADALPAQGDPVEEQRAEWVKSVRQLPGIAVEDGWQVEIDAVLWATGFRPVLNHLSPLGIRTRAGGITVGQDGVTAVDQPGLFLVGYGASASTIGATRAGRKAASAALRMLRSAA